MAKGRTTSRSSSRRRTTAQLEPVTLMKPREAASGDIGSGEIDEATGEEIKVPWVINPSELYPVDHPIVQGWPDLFVQAGPTAPGYTTLDLKET